MVKIVEDMSTELINRAVGRLRALISNLESEIKRLERDNTIMDQLRTLFDVIISEYLSTKEYFQAEKAILFNPKIEIANAEIQDRRANKLKVQQKRDIEF